MLGMVGGMGVKLGSKLWFVMLVVVDFREFERGMVDKVVDESDGGGSMLWVVVVLGVDEIREIV